MMHKNLCLFILFLTLSLLMSISLPLSAENTVLRRSKYLISAEQLKSRINDENLVIIDVRPRNAYVMGHIPGAVNMWKEDFSRVNGWIDCQIPSAEYFSFICQNRGINNNSEIIIYDEKTSLWSSRLWWIFNFFGHNRVRILDGGLAAWKNYAYQTKIFAVLPKTRGDFSVQNVKNSWLIDSDTLSLKIKNNNYLILDTRSPAEFSSEEEAGFTAHLPCAVNVEWKKVIDKNGFFKSAEEIRKIYSKKNIITNDKTIISVSNTAVRAAHSFFALTLAGFDNIKLYDDAYLGWHKKYTPQ